MSLKTSLGYLKFAPRMFVKSGALPLYFILFVTKNCNARCGHCLLGSHIRHTGELTIDELEKVSASMDDMIFFTPTGGEPFLRKDLGEIVKIFHKNNHVLNCGIPSNGSLTARNVEITEQILKSCPDMDLHIDISIDGIGDDHDKFRGFPTLFERAVRTYKELRGLEKHYPNFSVCVEIAVSGYNHEMLDEIYFYLKEQARRQYRLHAALPRRPQGPGRHHIRRRSTRTLPTSTLPTTRSSTSCCEQENYKQEITGYYKLPFADVLNA